VNPSTECPADLSCADAVISYDGLAASCKQGHISTLKASGLGLKSVPQSLNEMENLEFLNLANNELSSLPVFDKLTQLKTIYLYKNQLTSITGVFPNSKKIEFVSMNGNHLTELPPEFGDTKLKTLTFDNNDITSIPESYKDLTTITDVGMSSNKLDCSAVTTLFTLSSVFSAKCIQAQQRTEDDIPALPTEYTTEAPKEGLDGFEITAIVIACIFVLCAIIGTVLYVRYRFGGIKA